MHVTVQSYGPRATGAAAPRNMQGAAECHMCDRRSDYRGAIALTGSSRH